MIRSIPSAIIGLAIPFFLTSCVPLQNRQSFPSKVWDLNERTGFEESRVTHASSQIENYVRAPLNPDKKSDGFFDLYYFMQTPTGGRPEVKTVLFCAGGPGEILSPGDLSMATFLPKDATTTYNIVYFHLRGAGLSQLSPSNDYDKFLRTTFAVEDIEKIRKEVLGDRPWDGIIGYSYGTVLAHQYAARYSDRVRKLILVGPLSMHKFKGASSMTAYENYSAEVRRIRQEILVNVFDSNVVFKDTLTDGEKEEIKTALAKVFETIESNFGNEEFIFARYCRLNKTGLLSNYGLQGYSRFFFQMLRALRNLGWKPYGVVGRNLREDQVEAVKVISVGLIPNLRYKLGSPKPDDGCEIKSKTDREVNRAYRTLYGMRTYDGAHQRFLKEWLAETGNIRAALRKSAGLAHLQNSVNGSIEKVGISSDEPIKVWDPADYQHNVPALILEGEADPVTADKQAEYYFKHALIGPRTLVHFSGVGHEFHLPQVNVGKPFVIAHNIEQPFVVGSVRIDPGKIAPGSAVTVNNRITAFSPGGKPIDGGPVRFEGVLFSSHSNVVFVRAVNPEASDQDVKGRQLEYQHRLFTVTVTIDSPKVPHGVSWISGSVTKIIPKFVVEKPSNLEQGLVFESFQMNHWDELTVKIRNTSGQPIDAKSKEWMLFPTQENVGEIRAPCQGFRDSENASQCLIYAFLEMEHEDFKSSKNSILTYLKLNDIGRSQHCSGTAC